MDGIMPSYTDKASQIRWYRENNYTLTPLEEIYEVYKSILQEYMRNHGKPSHVGCLEFGVSVGGTLATLDAALCDEGLFDMPIIGFDSFQGLPLEAEVIEFPEYGWKEGSFRCDQGLTESFLKQAGVKMERVTLIPGWYKDTLTYETRCRLPFSTVAIVMVECCLSSSAQLVLNFIEPLIEDTYILFNCWDIDRLARLERGESVAFHAFRNSHPELDVTLFKKYWTATSWRLQRKPNSNQERDEV